MRQPTPQSDLYRWHENAIRGIVGPVHEDAPQCGTYRVRQVKGGPWLPAEIALRQVIVEGELAEDEVLLCKIWRAKACPWTWWTRLARNPISRDDFRALINGIERSLQQDPFSPYRNPSSPINLSRRVTWPTA